MPKAAMQSNPAQGLEYAIYTFDLSAQGEKSSRKWEKQDVQSEMSEALIQAETLFKSGKYEKVEIKQKYFDKKKDRKIDTTLKVYERKPKREFGVLTIMVFAIICGAAAFGVTYFLGRGG